MKFRSFYALALTSVLLAAEAFGQTSTAVAYKYASLNFPGSTSTTVIAINNHNAVVGSYSLGTTGTHGFLWQNGTFTTIDFPGAMSTVPVVSMTLAILSAHIWSQALRCMDSCVTTAH
jgi:hypothetical protein